MLSGPFPFGGGTPNGSTMLSTFGIMTAGTTSQSLLSSDGVFFGTVADSGSLADYRVYSAARDFSHQCNNFASGGLCDDPNANLDVIDLQATYHANQRESNAQLYLDAIGDPNGNMLTAPQSVIDAVEPIYGAGSMDGPLFLGASGLQWHQMEIRKEGLLVDWYMNGFKLITLDTTDWFDPNTPADDPNSNGTITPGGGNLSFGHSDTNFGSPTTLIGQELNYTLIDNIEVNAITAPPSSADFDGSGIVDGLDFLQWQRGDTPEGGSPAELVLWEAQYGGPPPLSGLSAVPEPATLFTSLTFFLLTLLGCRPCRQTARKYLG